MTLRVWVLALTLLSTAALGQSAPPLPEAPPPPTVSAPEEAVSTEEDDLPPPQVIRKGWYGWQTLAADGAGVLVGATLAAAAGARHPDVGTAGWIGTGMYMTSVTVSPLIHFAQRRPFQYGWGSLAARAVGPPLGAIIGAPVVCLALEGLFPGGDPEACLSSGVQWSFLIASTAISLLDSLLVGNITAEVAPAAATFYGWQLWIADALALALPAAVGVRAAYEGRPARSLEVVLGAMVYAVGLISSPVLHAVNGRFLAAVGGLGLRLLVPPLFMVAGMGAFCAATAGAPRCVETSIGPGLLLGTLATAAIDGLWLGFKPKGPNQNNFLPIVELSPERSRFGFAVSF